jgi:site-specific recombinase XerD
VIPLEISFGFVIPKADTVPPNMRVTPLTPKESTRYRGRMVEDAVELYMGRFVRRYTNEREQRRRRETLERFLHFLQQRGGPVVPTDLTREDGQAFMASLIKSNTGKPLAPSSQMRFLSGLRTFSRFLYDSGLIEEDVFRELE